MSKVFWLGAAAIVLALSTGAHAQTIGYADAIRTLSQSCGQDIQRFCSQATLANWGIGTCLDRNKDRISGRCAVDLVKVRQSLDTRAAAQARAFEVCQADARRLCPMTRRGRGFTLQCLLKAERRVSDRCNTAITNAGWR